MEAELSHLHQALDDPKRPVMAVVGGAKVSTKIHVARTSDRKVDMLVIGGAMANTFLAAEGIFVGRSLYEADQLATARRIVALANETGTRAASCPSMWWWRPNSRPMRITAPCR